MSQVTQEELAIMKEGGKITAKALQTLFSEAKPGMKLSALENRAKNYIISRGALPSFTTVPGYDYATCINVNEGVVHGVPSSYELKEGDVLSIDLGSLYKGFHTDSAWTVLVGESNDPTLSDFLAYGERALQKAIAQCVVGNTIGNISDAIYNTITQAGYTVSRDLVGHGVGRELHEDPQVPGFRDGLSENIRLAEGMVLAIEVIYMQGDYPIVTDPSDRWTISTKDGSIAALFEHSVAIQEGEPIVITKHD
jgi:methionyl aminopeptidase